MLQLTLIHVSERDLCVYSEPKWCFQYILYEKSLKNCSIFIQENALKGTFSPSQGHAHLTPGSTRLTRHGPVALYGIWHHAQQMVQVIAWRLTGTKLLPEPLLTLCQSNLQEQTPLKFYPNYSHFHSTKCSWKCCLQNTSHYVQAPWVINGKQYWICIVYHPWLAVVDFFFSCLSTCLHKVYVFGWWPRHNWHRFSWQKYTAHYMMKMSLHQYDISRM